MRTIVIDPNEPVVIKSYRFEHEAELARVLLEAAAIPCMVLPDTHTELVAGRARLAVRRGDVEDALEVLDPPAVAPSSEDDSCAT